MISDEDDDTPFTTTRKIAAWPPPPLNVQCELKRVNRVVATGKLFKWIREDGKRWTKVYTIQWITKYEAACIGFVCDKFGKLDVFKSKVLYGQLSCKILTNTK